MLGKSAELNGSQVWLNLEKPTRGKMLKLKTEVDVIPDVEY